LALSAASLLVSTIMLEGAVRAYRYGAWAVLPWIMESVRPIGNSGMVRPSRFFDIRYELLPNLDTYFKAARFRTNSYGLRDDEYPLVKPAGTYRVAVIGDSMTVPEGVEIEDAFHSLLEKRLTAESGGRRFEFINFAVGGYALPEYLGTARHRALEWQPDLILVGICINDYFWDEAYAAANFNKAYEVPRTIHPFFEWHLLPWIAEARANWGRRSPHAPPREWALPEPSREWMMRQFAAFGQLSAEAHVPILFAFVTHQSRGFASLVEAVRQGTAAHGMFFTDLSVRFPPNGDPGRYFIYRTDGHANAAAHRVFADTLYEFLTRGGVPGFPPTR
jgi:lysophospholipase L1-like esterase